MQPPAEDNSNRFFASGEEFLQYLEKLSSSDDFFVEDEPLEEVIAAFEQGEKHLTEEPKGTGWCAPSP